MANKIITIIDPETTDVTEIVLRFTNGLYTDAEMFAKARSTPVGEEQDLRAEVDRAGTLPGDITDFEALLPKVVILLRAQNGF